mmetsp:Transcript_29057/g.61038  ORF Transcript_29057/g.61038 Transcript_29057/m.61038 type:complete len:469 (+) Transcript_29057:443-1849(+)
MLRRMAGTPPAAAMARRLATQSDARLPSASPPCVPECVGCACMPAMMGGMAPARPARAWFASLLHARSPSASPHCCWTEALPRCIAMPAMMASMPPSAATRFWFSALPQTSLRMQPHASSTMPACPGYPRSASTISRGPRPPATRFLFASLSARFLSAQQQYCRHSWCPPCRSIAAMIGVIPSSCAIFTWLSSWQARLPRARAHFCWHPALSANRFIAAITAWIPPHWPTRCWTALLLQARSPRARAPCCDTLMRDGCAFIPATIASTPPSAAILPWWSALPQASLPSIWQASSTMPECPELFLSACTTSRWPLERMIWPLLSALRQRFFIAQQQYWMHSWCCGCSCSASRISWMPLSCAILTWFVGWQPRLPSARVHFCMQPPLRRCVCMARTISSTPPRSAMRCWMGALLHARLPSAEQPISCTSTLPRCDCIPVMMASMPPALHTEFCSSDLPHTRFRITCIPST